MTDKHVEAVANKLQERSQRGEEKYGGTLPENYATHVEQLQHLQEELMDGAIYCEWLMSRLKGDDSERLAQGWKDFAEAVGFPADRQRFHHHVFEHAKTVKAGADEMQRLKDELDDIKHNSSVASNCWQIVDPDRTRRPSHTQHTFEERLAQLVEAEKERDWLRKRVVHGPQPTNE